MIVSMWVVSTAQIGIRVGSNNYRFVGLYMDVSQFYELFFARTDWKDESSYFLNDILHIYMPLESCADVPVVSLSI